MDINDKIKAIRKSTMQLIIVEIYLKGLNEQQAQLQEKITFLKKKVYSVSRRYSFFNSFLLKLILGKYSNNRTKRIDKIKKRFFKAAKELENYESVNESLDYQNIPGCTYCTPEVSSVGYTEKAAKEAGYEVKIGKFPYSASGKASAAGQKDGFVKLIFDAKYGELLGGHMVGFNVTELIAEIVAIRKLETTGHELIKTVHPHPTMSEAIMEAAAAAYGEVIHL